MRDKLIDISQGFERMALEGYNYSDFPPWMRRACFRGSLFWNVMSGLVEGGFWGMLEAMVQHHREDRQFHAA